MTVRIIKMQYVVNTTRHQFRFHIFKVFGKVVQLTCLWTFCNIFRFSMFILLLKLRGCGQKQYRHVYYGFFFLNSILLIYIYLFYKINWSNNLYLRSRPYLLYWYSYSKVKKQRWIFKLKKNKAIVKEGYWEGEFEPPVSKIPISNQIRKIRKKVYLGTRWVL